MPTRIVLQFMLNDPGAEWYGREIVAATGVMSGTVHPILHRLARHGWLIWRWEERVTGRPPRRYFRFTEVGLQEARSAIDRAPLPDLSALKPDQPT